MLQADGRERHAPVTEVLEGGKELVERPIAEHVDRQRLGAVEQPFESLAQLVVAP